MNVELKAGSCGHCGAPLPVATGPVVVCGFCGRQYRAQPAAALPAAPPVFPGAPRPAAAASRSRLGLLIVVIGATAVLGLLAILLTPFLLRSAAQAVGAPAAPRAGQRPATAPPSPETLRAWHSRFDQALIQGEAGVPNIVGVVSRSDGATRLVALEGRTGKLLWSVPDNGSGDVYSNGADVILVYSPANTVTRRDAKTGAERWTIKVANFVHDITFGAGCASLRLNQPLGIDTQTGALEDCKPTREAQIRAKRNELHDLTFPRGDLVFRCGIQTDSKPINPEPARLTLSAKRGETLLWSVAPRELEPVWSSDGFDRSATLTPPGMFVYGRSPSEHQARWLLLDPAGRTSYSHSAPTKVDDPVWLTAAGPLVFVVHDRRLEAYAADTGKLAWLVAEPAP